MSEEIFTASNGIKFKWMFNDTGQRVLHFHSLDWVGGVGSDWRIIGASLSDHSKANGYAETSGLHEALEEFYLHQNGLWRDPETGALVIRIPKIDDRRGRAIRLIHEGLSSVYWETQKADNPVRGGIKDRYFAAHPAPKPWQEAKLKEAWLLTVDGVEGVYVMDVDNEFNGSDIDGYFMSYYRSYEGITAGKRIWPTEGGSK